MNKFAVFAALAFGALIVLTPPADPETVPHVPCEWVNETEGPGAPPASTLENSKGMPPLLTTPASSTTTTAATAASNASSPASDLVTVEEESAATTDSPLFYNGSMFCQMPGAEGELRGLRRQGGKAPKEWSFDVYKQVMRHLPVSISTLELPVKARVVNASTVLWVLHDMGLPFNLAHLNFDLLIPLTAARLHYFGLDTKIVFRLNVAPEGWAVPLLATIAGPGQPAVQQITPVDELTCYEKVYIGMPNRYSQKPTHATQILSSVTGQCWQVAHRLREEFYKYGRDRGVPLPALEPVPPATVQKPHLVLTYRLINPGGFGRNITNTEELMQVTQQRWGDRLTSELVAWETLPMLKQMEKAATAQIIAGVHGQNLAWNIMMRPGSVMLQFFTYGASMRYQGINSAAWDSFRLFERDLFCLNSTAINWASTTESDSLLEPEEKWKKDFTHRCKKKRSGKYSKYAWMCRNLRMRPHIWENLLGIALEHVGKFNSSFFIGGTSDADKSWLAYEEKRGYSLE